MNQYQSQFKDDIFSGIVDLVKAIWKPIFIGYVIYFAFSKLMTLGIMRLFGFSSVEEFTDSYAELMLDQDALLEWAEELKEMVLQPDVLAYVVGGMILFVLAMSWSYYYSYKVADKEIKEGKVDVAETFKLSINGHLLGLIGLSILIILAVWGAMILAILIAVATSPLLLIMLLPLVFYLGLKFFLSFPAYAIGNNSIKESIAFSFEHLTVIRTLKIVAIGFGVMMGLTILSAILQQIAQLMRSVPLTYIIVKTILEFITGGITLTITVAAFTGLYYRYADSIDGEEDFSIEDHLID